VPPPTLSRRLKAAVALAAAIAAMCRIPEVLSALIRPDARVRLKPDRAVRQRFSC
jgi:hypothetical protein